MNLRDAPQTALVPPTEVHLWTVDVTPDLPLAVQDFLTSEETARATGLRGQGSRGRFVAAHGALRHILGAYLQTRPADVLIERLPSGRPRLAGPSRGLDFNVSYAAGLMVCAVTGGARVGVDIESVHPADLQHDTAYLSSRERSALDAVSQSDRPAALAACWTRKEALAKAVGEGVYLDFSTFDVTVTPGDARLLSLPPRLAGTEWHLEAFAPGPGCLGAVAVEGPPVVLMLRRWRPPAQ